MNPPTDNHNAAHEAVQESAKRSAPETVREKMVDYGIEDTPPWYLSAMLGFQHFLSMVSSNIALPLLLARPACIEDALSGYADDMAKAELIGTLQFMSGVITFLQCTFGSRLPIVQGSTVALLPPTFAILNSMGSCPTILAPTANITEFMASNPDEISVVLAGSAEHKEVWRSRVRASPDQSSSHPVGADHLVSSRRIRGGLLPNTL